jgi:hypothetical protein
MSRAEAFRAEMAALIKQEKELEEELEEARSHVLLWARRGKLALAAGEKALATAARSKAVEAQAEFKRAQTQLDEIRHRKNAVRMDWRRPTGQDAERTIQAEVLLEQFRMQGLAPEEEELEQVSAQAGAEEALRELKGEKPTQPTPPPPTQPTAPPPAATAAAPSGLDQQLAALALADESAPLTPEEMDAIAALEAELVELRRQDEEDTKGPEGAE